jgi:hypothetical protein
MRVLVLSTRYPPEHAGGYELHCAGNVAHLRRHGHAVRVLTSGPAPDAPEDDVHRELLRFPAKPVPTPAADGRSPHPPAARRRPSSYHAEGLGVLSLAGAATVRSVHECGVTASVHV